MITRNFNRNAIYPPPPLNLSTIGDSRKRNAYDIFLKNVVQELMRQNVTDKIIIRKVIEILWRNSSTNERMAYRILVIILIMIDKIEKIKMITRNFNRNAIYPPPPLNLSTIGDSRKRNAYDIFLKNVVQELMRQNVTDKIIIRKVIEILWRNSSTNERMANFTLDNTFNLLVVCYGLAKDPNTHDYKLVLDYYNNDLRHFLKDNYHALTLFKKYKIIDMRTRSLNKIHQKNVVHRDLHSGNILYDAYVLR
ncbi:hypothetical protein Glove_195g14 [Diversispora epigaea]|uniref:Protein kinase domain-containing protein n=1 Tax=Diversispora epigaea TaxID=1348612 RepID=A0A397IPA2_9GLOM|nr:hypothetical protein Glove_195g14 [Diversispora epigaea]